MEEKKDSLDLTIQKLNILSSSNIISYTYKQVINRAVDLLKEQVEVEPHHKCIGETYSLITESHVVYCPWCGKKIKRT